MISQRTLLIAGAGASQPYGFPVGATLLQNLCGLCAGPGPVFNMLDELGYVRDGRLDRFCAALRTSGLPSIDIFLSRQPALSEVAKLALAANLSHLEQRSRVNSVDIEDDWYRHLWGRMQHGADNLRELVTGNRLRIVTFNYDRSLEYFLHGAMQHTFQGVGPQEAQAALEKLSIEHVYGTLAPFHYDAGPPYRGYEGPSTLEALTLAAEGIRIVPETKVDDPFFHAARKSFEWAEHLCFVGFSFHDWNTSRLDFRSVIDYLSERGKGFAQVFASTYGMTPTEVEAARIRTIGGRNWVTISAKTLDFLRNIDALN